LEKGEREQRVRREAAAAPTRSQVAKETRTTITHMAQNNVKFLFPDPSTWRKQRRKRVSIFKSNMSENSGYKMHLHCTLSPQASHPALPFTTSSARRPPGTSRSSRTDPAASGGARK